MKNNPFAGKSTRTKIFTVITVFAILVVFALNLWLSKYIVFGGAYIDLTSEGLYSLSPEMEKECDKLFDKLKGEIRITFCNDRDYLIDDYSTRAVYYMATAIDRRYDKCTVDAVNINMDPTAVARYRTTSLTEISPRDVIISYHPEKADGTISQDMRYRISSADAFWKVLSDDTVYSFDGEYQLMTYFLSLTLVDRPIAYFVTDHGETYYTANPETDKENEMNAETGVFVDLLHDSGFEVKTLSISGIIEEAEKKNIAPELPEDCVLLIINNPKEDFRYDSDKGMSLSYVSETEVLDRYMTDERGSIMVSLDYDESNLKDGKKLSNLEDFLAEWGIECTGLKVTDAVNSVDNGTDGDKSTIIADYNLDPDSYASNIYGNFATMSSAPRFVVNNTGSLKTAFGIGQNANEPGSSKTRRIFTPFIYSSEESNAYAQNAEGEYNTLAANGKQVVAALGSRQTIDQDTGEFTHSYVFCAASTDFLSSDYLGNSSYANFDVVSALVQNICRLDTFADTSLGGGSMNGEKFYGKEIVNSTIRAEDESKSVYNDAGELVKETYLGLTTPRRNVIIAVLVVIPTVIAAVGIFVCIKRKYL